jgi:hypothetical protein
VASKRPQWKPTEELLDMDWTLKKVRAYGGLFPARGDYIRTDLEVMSSAAEAEMTHK